MSTTCRVARQQIDLARLQGGEALLRRGRHELHLVGIAEDRDGDGSADIDVEPGPLALAVGAGEAGDAGGDATNETSALLDRLEILTSHGAGRHEDRGQTGRRCH